MGVGDDAAVGGLAEDFGKTYHRYNPRLDKAGQHQAGADGRQLVNIADQQPKHLTHDAVRASDVVITMGCSDTCPIYPGKRYEDWDLEDPAGKDITVVRRVRDQIKTRVQTLIGGLLPAISNPGS